MVRVEMQKWGQDLEDLRDRAIQAPHPRTRERFLALSLIADGTHNATTWAAQFGRQDDTVLHWVHTYNQEGPDALTYRRTGGAPLLRPRRLGVSSGPSSTPSRSTTGFPATAGR
jgi:Helix-turn-helix domain